MHLPFCRNYRFGHLFHLIQSHTFLEGDLVYLLVEKHVNLLHLFRLIVLFQPLLKQAGFFLQLRLLILLLHVELGDLAQVDHLA